MLMGGYKLPAGDGGAHGDLAAKYGRSHDLGKFLCFGCTVASHDGERFALRGKPRAATDCGDRQGRQREAHVESLRVQFENSDAARGVDHVGYILSGGDEDSGQPIGILRVVAYGVGVQVSNYGGAPDVEE